MEEQLDGLRVLTRAFEEREEALKVQVSELQERANTLKSQNADLDKARDLLRGQLLDLQYDIRRSKARIVEQKELLASQGTHIAELQTQLQLVTHERDKILNSTAWRLTSPARKVIGVARRNDKS